MPKDPPKWIDIGILGRLSKQNLHHKIAFTPYAIMK